MLAIIDVLLRVSLWTKLWDLRALRLHWEVLGTTQNQSFHSFALFAVLVPSSVVIEVIVVEVVLLLDLGYFVNSGCMLTEESVTLLLLVALRRQSIVLRIQRRSLLLLGLG